MSDKSPSVSMSKNGKPASVPTGPLPKQIRLSVAALALTVVGILATGASLFWLKSFLLSASVTANNKLKAKDRKSHQQLVDQVHSLPGQLLLQSGIYCLALAFVAYSLYRGKYWSRWGVLGLWILASFTGQTGGFINSVLGVTSSAPLAYKVPGFIAGIAFVVAVILVCLRPSTEFLNKSRPTRPGGAPARRGGLFGPRPAMQPRQASSKIDTSAAKPAVTKTAPDRSRSKARASTEAVAKGAELARSRAKASKSRRSAT